MRYILVMRTTLSIDDDVLIAARALAEAERRSIGEVVSELARRSLRGPKRSAAHRNGLVLLPERPGGVVTLEMVNAIRDEEP